MDLATDDVIDGEHFAEFMEQVLAVEPPSARIEDICVQDHSDFREPHLHIRLHLHRDDRRQVSSWLNILRISSDTHSHLRFLCFCHDSSESCNSSVSSSLVYNIDTCPSR